MKRTGGILIVFIFVSLFCGCDKIFQKNIKEGFIDFKITYPEIEASNVMAGILPHEMKLMFKENKTSGEFTAGMGIFKITLITYPETKIVYQLMKLMSKKYAIKIDSSDLKSLYAELPEMTVKLVDETKIIAGYKCKKAMVTFKNNIKEEFSIYYTDEIGLVNSNWCTPFHEISGVLLEYQVRKYNFEMKFSAINVVKEKIDDSVFELPSDYELISQEEMDKIFEGFKEI